MRSLGSASSILVASRISFILRVIETSFVSNMFLATCWVIVDAPIGRRLARNRPISVIAARKIDSGSIP